MGLKGVLRQVPFSSPGWESDDSANTLRWTRKRKEGGGRPQSPPTRLLLSPHHGPDGPDHHEGEDGHEDCRGIQARGPPALARPDALLGDHGRAPGAVRMT